MLIDWFTVAAQVVNFLVLVWLLKRFLYKPVLNAIDEREKRIATQIQDAEKKKAEALKEQIDFQHKNEVFDQERSKLLVDATNAAKAEREKLMEATRKDAEELRAKLQKANHDEVDSLSRKIGAFARKEVFSITRKTLTDLAGADLEERITEVFVRRLHTMNDTERERLKECLNASSKTALVRSAFDLSDARKVVIADALKSLVGEGTKINFETKPELISGIELVANGQKIAWSIVDYLTDLATALGAIVESKSGPTPVPAKIVPNAA